ncbi:TlpA disulfide reductase family protein [Paraglaciecola sp. L1A13]|uniref:TlpA disulfide reductase family protein n=1 Tax=Paraglaciecola sp. L1A13 TaxID=2686359 RepID=UPI00131D6ED4|nr:TlpA disulfide reductase family protein [Paraglaciecola sp. L1A13]
MRFFIACFVLYLASYANNGYASVAPNFSLTVNSVPVELSELKGKVVYIDFWASWCKPCRQSFPWLNDMQQKYAKQGLVVVAVNLDTEAELVNAFLEKIPANFPIVLDPDGEIAQRYELIGMPSSYLIARDGSVRFSHKGFFSAKKSAYEQQLVSLLQELE